MPQWFRVLRRTNLCLSRIVFQSSEREYGGFGRVGQPAGAGRSVHYNSQSARNRSAKSRCGRTALDALNVLAALSVRGMHVSRLSPASTASLPDTVARPAFDRGLIDARIVHLGIGAFHRAHQALYTDDAPAAAAESGGFAA